MEPRESGSCSIQSFFSTPRKNLAIILSRSLLKNSEDVQDALIEDYFRYDDLSRMEEDDILMNISEIESPNYEYVELDLLNLPRDLSTNLNEDSDNQKENVVRNKRIRMVT
jgi:hypothetical protein